MTEQRITAATCVEDRRQALGTRWHGHPRVPPEPMVELRGVTGAWAINRRGTRGWLRRPAVKRSAL